MPDTLADDEEIKWWAWRFIESQKGPWHGPVRVPIVALTSMFDPCKVPEVINCLYAEVTQERYGHGMFKTKVVRNYPYDRKEAQHEREALGRH